jgi:hypothetical protein
MKNAVPIEATVNPSWCSGLLVLFAILLLGCLDSSDPTGGIDPPDPVGCLDPSDPTGCLDPSDSSDHAPEENPPPLLTCGDSLPPITLANTGTWARHAPRGIRADWNGVAWTGSRLVAVGDSGTIWSSPTGEEWVEHTSGVTLSLHAVTCSPRGLVAVGDSGTILSSKEGESWTRESSGTQENLYALDYRNGFFVTAGTNGALLTSTGDGIWVQRTSGTPNDLKALVSTDTLFLVVGDSGTLLTSPDGVTWTLGDVKTSLGLRLAVVLRGKYTVYSTNEFSQEKGYHKATLESSDGVTWSISEIESSQALPRGFEYLKAIEGKNEGKLFGIFLWPSIQPYEERIRVSYDSGVTWDDFSVTPVAFFGRALAWTGERIVMVGIGGGVFTIP